MLLRALAEAPDLRLRVLAGEDALDRPVDGVFTTDLLDPRRYLTGGEIVLTGLMWYHGPADSETFVAAVVAAGAAGLAAGDAAFGSVPADLVDACRRHGLPLFGVPVDVSFAAITEQVLAARLRPAGPSPAVARLRSLAAGRGGAGEPGSGAGDAPGLAEAFDVAAREYGTPGWVLSAAGRLVAGAAGAPGWPARSALAGAWLGAATLPVTVLADGAPYSLFGVPGEPAHRLAGWFVALAGDQAGWDAGRRAIAGELAAAAGGHRARHEEAQRAARRAADDALGRLLEQLTGDGPDDPQIAAGLRRCGLAPRAPLVAVALTAAPARLDAVTPGAVTPGAATAGAVTPGAPRPDAAGPRAEPAQPVWPQVARVLLEEMLPAPVAGVTGGEAVALCPGDGAVVDGIREVARALAGAYGPDGGAPERAGAEPGTPSLAFGVSVLPAGDGEPHPGGGRSPRWTAAGLRRALARARQAGRVAALLGAGVRLVDAAGLGSVDLLLATAPAEARQAFRGSLLSPLLDYDRDHGTELVRTLRVFLDCSGSWTKASDAMFVHVNSLRYRIRRVEELTGRDLGSLAGQAALLLALRLAGRGSAEDQDADPGGGGGVDPGRSGAG